VTANTVLDRIILGELVRPAFGSSQRLATHNR